jgi:Cyclic phosphodiesterase-like protein
VRTKRRVIAYWLIPAKSERELFRKLIRILAREFDAPAFEPHVTLFSAPEARRLPKSVLRSVTGTPVRLQIRETAFSMKYTKTLYVRLAPNKSLEKLVVNLGRAVKARAKAPGDPHISLLYKRLPMRIKEELASAIKLPLAVVTFDSIKAVRCTTPTATAADVKAWRVIAAKRLAG